VLVATNATTSTKLSIKIKTALLAQSPDQGVTAEVHAFIESYFDACPFDSLSTESWELKANHLIIYRI